MTSDDETIAQLRHRLATLVAEVPKLTEVLRGTLGERLVSCGKEGCHCREGRKHGPVYFLSVGQGRGHTVQMTLSKEAFDLAQRFVANYARTEEIVEEVSRLNPELLRLTHPRSRTDLAGRSRRHGSLPGT